MATTSGRRAARRAAARIAVAAFAAWAVLAAGGLGTRAAAQIERVNRRPPTVGKLYPGTLPSGPGREIASRACVRCHSASMITQQRKDEAGWTKTLAQMTAWGADLREEDRERLRDYLVRNFGPRR